MSTVVERTPLPRWVWLVALGLFVQYSVVGIWLVIDRDYMIGDAVARSVSAQVMVLSRDPHLGAMGFYWMPLPMFVRVPFVLVLAPFGQQALAGPLASALAAALVVPALVKLCLILRVNGALATVLVATYALNPVTVFSAANAMSESTFALFLALTFVGFARFHRDRRVADLSFWGLALAGGLMSRIEFVPLTIASVVAACLLVPRREWRSVAAMVAIPPAAVMAAWSLASSLIAGDALFWYHEGKLSGTTPEVHPWMPADLTPVTILGYVGFLMIVVVPGVVLLPLALAALRTHWRAWCGIAMLVLTVPAFIWLQLQMRTSWGNPRYFAVLPLCVVAAALWVLAQLAQLGSSRRIAHWVFGAGFAVAGIAGAIVAAYVYSDPVRTGIESESVFFAAVTGRDGPADPPGRFAPLDSLLDVLEPQLADGKVIAMDTRLGTPLLMTEHTSQFIVPEDREFEEIMSDPSGRFDLALLPTTGATSSYSQVIAGAMGIVDGGSFEPVGEYGMFTLYEFVPSAPSGVSP